MSGRHIRQLITVLATFAWTVFSISSAQARTFPERPQPQRLVNDLAGIFSNAQVETLERMLVALDDSTSNQICVISVPDLEGQSAAEYATRIGIGWGVGSEKFDNGVVVLVKPKTDVSSGEVFIAVGYGLEGAIPDAYAKRIIESIMLPHFRNNDYYNGVLEACKVLMQLASGEISEFRDDFDDDDIAMIASVVLSLCIIILLVALAIKNNNGSSGKGNGSRGGTIYTGPVFRSSNWGSGGSSFGGGGFGGFGGGSFGGGGAGGRW